MGDKETATADKIPMDLRHRRQDLIARNEREKCINRIAGTIHSPAYRSLTYFGIVVKKNPARLRACGVFEGSVLEDKLQSNL
jgi:hypothetical protein